MSELSDKIRSEFKKADDERDALMNTPEDIERWDNIVYGHDDREMQRLDVYRPKQAQDQKYNGIIKLQIHPVIPSRTGQLNHSIFLVYLKAIAKNAQIFFKFFPVFQHKIIICFGILVSFAQKAGSQKTVANPAEIILFFLQHSFQIFHFLSSVSENL